MIILNPCYSTTFILYRSVFQCGLYWSLSWWRTDSETIPQGENFIAVYSICCKQSYDYFLLYLIGFNFGGQNCLNINKLCRWRKKNAPNQPTCWCHLIPDIGPEPWKSHCVHIAISTSNETFRWRTKDYLVLFGISCLEILSSCYHVIHLIQVSLKEDVQLPSLVQSICSKMKLVGKLTCIFM